ncbi:4312_t:CDS:2 [Ambispora leptoticha]|uniref:Zinc finger CCCH domain-containing protein 15 n=1 Tax=Ambispora leptoticha TaxID=144679 RepID=A0A9N8VNM5_9GLOM|nr:4312_t:CDS:2 [Ambispora leptoticha]
MPPKKNTQSNKSKEKEKQKVIEDKTFGLKNKKKSAKVQQQIKQIQTQVMAAGDRKAKKEQDAAKQALAEKKAAEQKKKEELAELFKPVQTQKVPFGVDPKTVLCAFFKAGQCQKGDKCKFSHDLDIERKTTKIDLYTDVREDEKSQDTMDKWDQSKLEQVVLSKHGNPKTTTDIVCKYFLEAIENQKYGWFWECPNGGKNCKYRHALPPGFVLKTKAQKKAEAEEEDQITLEEFLETERHKLGSNLTPVTLETFTEWKKNRKAKIEAEAEAKRKAKEAAFKAGKGLGMSGRDLFTFNPELVNQGDDYDDGEDVFDISGYKHDNEDNEDNDNNSNGGIKDVPSSSLASSHEKYEGNPYGEGSSSNSSNSKTNNGISDVEVKEDLFEAENLDDLEDDDDE